jgi:hypothetical protein
VHVQEHRRGRAAVLTAVARAAGLDFKVTRTWPGGHDKERQLKTRSGALYCPDCSPHPQPGTTPPDPRAEYLTRRQREARAAASLPERTPLWLLERTAVEVEPHECGSECECDQIEAAVSRFLQDAGAEPRKEGNMSGRERRAATRAEAARRAQADALFAEADRWAEAAGEPPDFRREITRERAARVMAQIGDPLAQDARAAEREPELTGAERDAETGRLGEAERPCTECGQAAGDWHDPGCRNDPALAGFNMLGPEPGPDAATWRAAEAGAQADSPALQGDLYPEPEGPQEWPRAWEGLMASRNAAEAARERENAAAAAQRVALGEQREHPGPQAFAAAVAAGRELREARAAHVTADATVYAAAARLQETAIEPDGLPRLLDQADAGPRAPEAWQLADGTPHTDPVLAARGWQAQGGIYRRVPQAEHELEAG